MFKINVIFIEVYALKKKQFSKTKNFKAFTNFLFKLFYKNLNLFKALVYFLSTTTDF